jgi:hypothetical protein
MKQLALWLALSVYLYFFNHLLVVPAFAEYSYYGFLVIPFMLFVFWLIPENNRKQAVVFTFLFLLIDKAIGTAYKGMDTVPFYLSIIFIGLFLYPIVRWYGKLRVSALAASIIVAFTMNLVFPDKVVQALPHFYPKWISETLYIGDSTDYFPMVVEDIDGDGAVEVVTYGNAEEWKAAYPDGLRTNPPTYLVEEDPLSLYVWKWQNGEMIRVPNEQLDTKEIAALLPNEYIGFPYFVMTKDLVLEPLIQRQALAEGMMQFGTSPYRALLINLENIDTHLESTGGAYDVADHIGERYRNVRLQAGLLTGTYDNSSFEIPSDATRIVSALRLSNGQEGLLVLGSNLQLMQMIDGKLSITHELTRQMQKGLAQSEFKIVDIDQDGVQELVIAFPYSAILAPEEDGTWDLLWNTEERSFRFEDVGSFDPNGEQELISLSKSLVRASDRNYLTSYRYTEEGLARNWKVMLPLINVKMGDLDGDGTQELISTISGSHKIYVFEKHGIPVTMILIALTVLLVAVLAGRRGYLAKK